MSKSVAKTKAKDIEILYEDNDIVAVNKPAGLMVHSDGRSPGPFLTDWIIKNYPETLKVGEPARDADGKDVPRPGIVHRLDRETSGVILIAKTAKGFETLKNEFKDRTIKKKYLAWVWGDMQEEFGTINKPIGRSGSDFRKRSAQRGARGEMREAETYWSKIRNMEFEVPGTEETNRKAVKRDRESAIDSGMRQFTLIEAEPKTGRTHQIRVHFAAVQHPIVGDTLYAPKMPMALGFMRLALHSRSIEFVNCEGKKIRVEAPFPADFERIRQLAD